MPGKMEEKMKEILKHSRHSQSGISQAIYELARHIDQNPPPPLDEEKKDTPESDKEANPPSHHRRKSWF